MTFGTRPPPRGNVIPFPAPGRPVAQSEVGIFPCPIDGGSWGVDVMSASGDAAAFLGSFFSFDEAVSFARRWATENGAAFDEGGAA